MTVDPGAGDDQTGIAVVRDGVVVELVPVVVVSPEELERELIAWLAEVLEQYRRDRAAEAPPATPGQ